MKHFRPGAVFIHEKSFFYFFYLSAQVISIDKYLQFFVNIL